MFVCCTLKNVFSLLLVPSLARPLAITTQAPILLVLPDHLGSRACRRSSRLRPPPMCNGTRAERRSRLPAPHYRSCDGAPRGAVIFGVFAICELVGDNRQALRDTRTRTSILLFAGRFASAFGVLRLVPGWPMQCRAETQCASRCPRSRGPGAGRMHVSGYVIREAPSR